MRRGREIGVIAELDFQRRLIELGYAPIMTPASMDSGADFVVWTSRGWIGVQVKCGKRIVGVVRGCVRRAIEPYVQFALPQGSKYYAARGVSVYAVAVDRGFYLVPIDVPRGKNNARFGEIEPYWEAWERVLGSPITALLSRRWEQPRFRSEADPLEQMLLIPSAREVRDA